MRRTKIVAAMLSLVFVFMLFPSLRVSAASTGECGTDLTYTLDDAGNLTISGTGTKIKNNAFSYNTSIKTVTMPDSVTSIGTGVFFGCKSLETIEMPEVTSIEEQAFNGCKSLKNIKMPEVTSIGFGVFYGCTSLTDVTIGNKVTSIDYFVFLNCTNLTTVTMNSSLAKQCKDRDEFKNCPSDLKINYSNINFEYKNDDNGTVTGYVPGSDPTTVYLTLTPDTGYVVNTITVTDSTGTTTISSDSSGNYSFPLPSGDATVDATFKPIQKTVTFKNEDGTVLQSGDVDYGTTPAFIGATPSKAEDDKYTYTFTGWSDGTKTYGPTDTLPAVTDDATYTAVFYSTVRKFTIKFINEDGTILKSGDFDYGTTPAYTGSTPTKAEDDDYTYTFAGWTPAITSVTGNATYTATFTETAKPTPEPTTPAPVTVAKPGTYYLSSMAEQDGNIVITIKMSEDDTKTFDLLGTVTSDGVPLTEGNQYTSAKGSAIITINKSFLDTLAAGNHKLTVTFTDGGSITIDYEVKAPAAAPQAAAQAVQATGEAVSAASIAGACLILAAAGIAFTVTRKRKEEA